MQRKSGQTRRFTALLPVIPLAETLNITRLHRVAGRTSARAAVVTTGLFPAPLHPATIGPHPWE